MTAYLLDTNICVHIINGKFDLAARLKRAVPTAKLKERPELLFVPNWLFSY